MAKLTKEKPAWETEGVTGRRALMIRVGPRCIQLWPKGTRSQRVQVTWESIYLKGCMEKAAAIAAAKPARRRGVTRGKL